MDIETLVWSTAASLPYPYYRAAATICGDQLYMLGGNNEDGAMIELVLMCSVTKLLHSCAPDSVWHRIADTPTCKSTCAAVNGELVIVGGMDAEFKSTSAVHLYNPTTNTWDIIGNMITARYGCLVAVLPDNEIMVVGGGTNKIEMAYYS